jgi:predicted  nucleic acid-binding Zn-ribbon protein
LYLITGIIYLKADVIIPLMFILPILYVYYKIWFNFDINTLDKDIKKGTKIINEHSNITTIIKSGSGTAISTARLELYKHSYFMNLYKNAFENYTEKITEIEDYKSNKHLTEKANDDANAAQAAQAAQETNEKEKEQIKGDLKDKNKVFKEKTDDISIARAERRDVENQLKDFDSKNDKKLKGLNRELFKNKFNIGYQKPADAIQNIKDNVGNLLDTKKDLRKELRELKTSENKAREAINTGVQNKINNVKDTLGKNIESIIPGVKKINKEGLMNMGKDYAKNMFDKVKI